MILHISQCMCRLCVICDSGNGSFWARENKPPGISGESRVRKITKAHVIISLKKKKKCLVSGILCIGGQLQL